MEVDRETTQKIHIFYSYAHEDEELLNHLTRHLSLLKQKGIVDEWYDRDIVAGDNRIQDITSHLEAASIILLLISSDFLASQYCYSVEMQYALERHESGHARVIPIILRPVDWQDAPFAHLTCLPRNRKPVTIWSNQDEAFLDIAKGIRKVIEDIHRTRSNAAHYSLMQNTEQPLHVAREDRNRQRLLNSVHATWIAGVLEQSMFKNASIILGLHEEPNVMLKSWHAVMQETRFSSRSLGSGTRIIQAFDNANGELLIIGEPGAGKTTLLLELARDLLMRAKSDQVYPIPVVFNLSSWTQKRLPLSLWLIEELEQKYKVPRSVGSAWVRSEQILPLLDGLDEVASNYRTQCINTINAYLQEQNFPPIVVCCRSQEYMTLELPITLQKAVEIQPLTQQQIDKYLLNVGERVEVARLVLSKDPTLQEMITTPLMLNVLIIAYSGKSLSDVVDVGSPQTQQQLFASYIKRVLYRRTEEKRYTEQQTTYWLSYLATQMQQHNQNVFYIEHLQPDWLPLRLRQYYELLAVRLPDMFIGGLISLLVITIISNIVFNVTYALLYSIIGGWIGWVLSRRKYTTLSAIISSNSGEKFFSSLMHRRHLVGGAVLGVSYGLLIYNLSHTIAYGLSYGAVSFIVGSVLCTILDSPRPIRPFVLGRSLSLQNFWHNLVYSDYLVNGLLIGASYGSGYVLSTVLVHGFQTSIGDVLAYALLYTLNFTFVSVLLSIIIDLKGSDIYPTEILIWSWMTFFKNLANLRHLKNALLLGVSTGIIIGLSTVLSRGVSFGLSYGLSIGIDIGLSYWLFVALFRGLSSNTLDEHLRVKANQGIRLSAKLCAFAGLIGGIVSWIVFSLSYLISYVLSTTITRNVSVALTHGWHNGVVISLSVGLSVGLSLGVLCGLLNGGIACIRHYFLRLLLWSNGLIPWNYSRFLDYAHERILLQKVGGGYIFVHRLLLEYFASLHQ